MDIASADGRGNDLVADTGLDHDLQDQVRTLTALNNEYVKEIRELQQKVEYLNFRACSSATMMTEKAQQDGIDLYVNSYAFRVGQVIVDAVRKPGKNTLAMPFRLMRLMFEIATKRRVSKKL